MRFTTIFKKPLILLTLFSLLSMPLSAYTLEKTIRVTVGYTFSISPWTDVQSSYSGYTCAATYLSYDDNYAFTVNPYSRVKTTYVGTGGFEQGFYESYSLEALKVGQFIVYGQVTCYRSSVAYPVVKYNVIVSEKSQSTTDTPVVYDKEIVVKVTEGDVFTINPWNDGKSGYPGYSCSSATVKQIQNEEVAFSVNSNDKLNYQIEALKPGIFSIEGSFLCTGSSIFSRSSQIYKYIIVVSEKKKVNSIIIPQTLQLNVGDNYTFNPIISEEGASASLNWTTTNPSVIKLESGSIRALKVGSAKLACTAQNSISACCEVTVMPILVEKIALVVPHSEIYVGEKMQLRFSVQPENATTTNLEWSSSNENIAVVDSNGEVTGVSKGTCTIKAKAKDNSMIEESVTIKILPDYSRHDINGDGKTTIQDVNTLIDYLLNSESDNEGIHDNLEDWLK